jgi:HD-like signal output (HDOD) protein
MSQPHDTIKRVIDKIPGLALCNVLLSVAIHSKMFHMVSEKSKEMELLWNHSLACAHISRSIATKLQIHTAGREYIAGLLHDIGKIVLIEYYDRELEQICMLIEKVPQTSLIDDEGWQILLENHRHIAGTDHEQVVSELKKELKTLSLFPAAEKLNNNTINEK